MIVLTSTFYNLPNSTKALLSSLVIVSSLIFLIKVRDYRSILASGEPGAEDLKFHDVLVPYLQLIPRTAIFYPWVVVPAIFAEITIFSWLTSFVILFTSSKYVEKFWGYREVLKFVFVVGALTNLWTVLATIVVNISRGEESKSMDQPLGGGILYYFGFLVVLKQLIPEHNIILFQGVMNFRIKHIPFIFLVLVLFWSLLISRSMYPFIPLIGSFIISYNYLRFHQTIVTDPLLPITTANGGVSEAGNSLITGDASDAFRLVEFFPSACKPFLLPAFDVIYNVSCLLGIVIPFNDEIIEQSNLRAQKRLEQANQQLKSVANSVAERRRQVALQMIEERVNREPST